MSSEDEDGALDYDALLIDAAQTDNLEMATTMLAAGAVRDFMDAEGYTALRFACEKSHLAIAQLLVKEGFNVMACNDDGASLLHTACGFGHLDIAIWLLTDHADGMMATYLRSEDSAGATLLHLSCRRPNQFPLLTLVLSLVMRQEAAADVSPSALAVPLESELRDEDGVLMEDPFGPQVRARIALEREFHRRNLSFLNQLDNFGWSALHVACLTGCMRSAEWLMLHGADYARRSGPSDHCALDLAPRPCQAPLRAMGMAVARARRDARRQRLLVAALVRRRCERRSPRGCFWVRAVQRIVQLAAPINAQHELALLLQDRCAILKKKTDRMLRAFEKQWVISDRENRRLAATAHRRKKADASKTFGAQAAPRTHGGGARPGSSSSGRGGGGSRGGSAVRPGSRDSATLPLLRPPSTSSKKALMAPGSAGSGGNGSRPDTATSRPDTADDLGLDIVDEYGVIDQQLLSEQQKLDLEQLRSGIMNWRKTFMKSNTVPQSMKTYCVRYRIPFTFARKCLEDKTFRKTIRFRRKDRDFDGK